jgi:hypothetical protein
MKVTDSASNIKKSFKFFDRDICFLHTLKVVVREFMSDESVQSWMIKIKGLCRHLKIILSDSNKVGRESPAGVVVQHTRG